MKASVSFIKKKGLKLLWRCWRENGKFENEIWEIKERKQRGKEMKPDVCLRTEDELVKGWAEQEEEREERESLTEERSLRETLLAVAVLSGSEDRQLWGLLLTHGRWRWCRRRRRRRELPLILCFL